MMIRKDLKKCYRIDALDLLQLLMGGQATNRDVVLPCKIRLKINRLGGINAALEPLVVSLQTIMIRKNLDKYSSIDALDLSQLLMGAE